MLSSGGGVRRGVAPGASLVRHAALRFCGRQSFSASAETPSAQVQQHQDNVEPYPNFLWPFGWGVYLPTFAYLFDVVPMEVMGLPWGAVTAGLGFSVTTFRIAYNDGAAWQRAKELLASIRRQEEASRREKEAAQQRELVQQQVTTLLQIRGGRSGASNASCQSLRAPPWTES
ncbi:hypothetical protein WJX72_011314 [[Myrmecia] bisecta]|uniref:Uncharacterized protein n=1 Tax=[Myrmecia] bisecta TaxID=41462 RepID=A0AAW1P563_9CHLO